MVFMILGAMVALVIVWAVACYNRLVSLRSMAEEAWSGIDVQLKRRYDLIPNLVEVVKGYSIHEKEVLTDVIRLRTESMNATEVDQKETAEIGLASSLKTLFAVAEQYPDLKANENFLTLQKELSSIEQELQYARRYYNGSVRNYVISIKQFPSIMIAKLFAFMPMSYFELSSDKEREVPSAKF